MKRPSDARLLAMVQYIRSLGLDVYGGYTNLRTGEEMPGCMDYSPRQVVTYRKLKESGKLHEPDEERMADIRRRSVPPMSDEEIEACIIDGTIVIKEGDDLWGKYKHLTAKLK
jgi:hypothetical protein